MRPEHSRVGDLILKLVTRLARVLSAASDVFITGARLAFAHEQAKGVGHEALDGAKIEYDF